MQGYNNDQELKYGRTQRKGRHTEPYIDCLKKVLGSCKLRLNLMLVSSAW